MMTSMTTTRIPTIPYGMPSPPPAARSFDTLDTRKVRAVTPRFHRACGRSEAKRPGPDKDPGSAHAGFYAGGLQEVWQQSAADVDEAGGEADPGVVVEWVGFPAGGEPPPADEPREEPLDPPSLLVVASDVLLVSRRLLAIGSVRCEQLGRALSKLVA